MLIGLLNKSYTIYGRECERQNFRKVFRKFCPLCYKQVIALSPRRIKDKFHLYFQTLKIRVKIYP